MNINLPLWSAIIPTYGKVGIKLTKRCLRSLQHSTESNEIIVVDDGSKDWVQEQLEELCSEFGARFIGRSENGGFAKACNIGIVASNGKVVTLVNNDTEQINKTLDDLANFTLFSGAATVGCKLLYEDKTVQHGGVYYVPAVPHGFWDHIARFRPRWDAVACRIKRSLCTGAMLAINRFAIDGIGFLDERYGMAVEDIDYQLRCIETGYRVFYCGTIEAYHLEGKTRGRTPAEKAQHPDWTQAEVDGMALFFERWKGIEFRDFMLGGQ